MSMAVAAGIILAVLILAACIVLLWLLAKKRHEGYAGAVIMKNGIDIEHLRSGEDKGEYFQGGNREFATYVISGNKRSIYRLHFTEQSGGAEYTVQFRECMGIGRAVAVQGMEAFLTIKNDLRISGFHCRIFEKDGRLYLEDAGSKNHTKLNEKIVDGPVILHNQDKIRVGNTHLTVRM